MADLSVFERLESEVRSYCRDWPTVFNRASGSRMWDTDGSSYIDFFAGAGALNYGHNAPFLVEALVEYLRGGGIIHSLDMSTSAKERFLLAFEQRILQPRGLDYKVQFPGPTGTNSVEAALKLARKIKGREQIISFTNGFHGMTLGSLSVTGNAKKRRGAGVPLTHATSVPYCNYMEEGSSIGLLEELLADGGSGLDQPAAVIVETVQGEGGINVASWNWLRRLSNLCAERDILLIVDDIQMGCGRTGTFFSFERAGIQPDIVCLSKSISGCGLPMALTLMKPELDAWDPGEHNGTFRGNNAAFVTAAVALDHYWSDSSLEREVDEKGSLVSRSLASIAGRYPELGADTRGRGLALGLVFDDSRVSSAVCAQAFNEGLLVESAGPQGEVVKLMPALTIATDDLIEGLSILDHCVARVADIVSERAVAAVR
ncbi:MAG: diaminobutyrate--2-oxoglutarate transaminase [Actinomycetota bacterium]